MADPAIKTSKMPSNRTIKNKELNGFIKVICLTLFLAACNTVTQQRDSFLPTSQRFDTESRHIEFADPFSCLFVNTLPLQAEQPTIEALTVWEQIPLGYQMDWRQQHPRITSELNWYIRHPNYMKRVSKRAQRYIHFVSQELAAHNMPQELALLPIVESAYDPFAYSHGRASGMWQFIPSTGRFFKLRIDWWYDGRRDIIASSQAAVRYLDQLQKRFDGDWLLALAAYNAGQGNVSKAIRKNKKLGKPTDFWNLDLPKETRSYVPKLLALSKVVATPQRYGMELYPVVNQPYFVAVDTETQIDLAEAAAIANIDIDELYRLNPGFNRWATAPDGPHRLLIPATHAEQFKTRLAEIPPEQRLHWVRHKVKSGESLLRLAKRYNTDASIIRQVNEIRGNMIKAGQQLLIPTAAKGSSHYALSSDQRLQRIQTRSSKPGREQTFHHVSNGESLWTIAKRYQVRVKQIASWNGMAPKDTIRPGQKLSLWIDKASAQTAGLQREPVVRKVGYKVRKGDSLSRIAGRFNVPVNDIVKWNPVNPDKYLKPGQHLTLYVDITRGVN
jgi:membrane-bound lytic murein transglycosylase D